MPCGHSASRSMCCSRPQRGSGRARGPSLFRSCVTRKLVEDKTLELILNAALIAHYGRAMLAFDRLEGRA